MTTTKMTEEDLLRAPVIANKMIEHIMGESTPASVAGAAMAFAAIVELAQCGPAAAWRLFEDFRRRVGAATAPGTPAAQSIEKLVEQPKPTGDAMTDLMSVLSYLQLAADRGFDLNDPTLRMLIFRMARAEEMRIKVALQSRIRNAHSSDYAPIRVYLKMGVITEEEGRAICVRSGLDPDKLIEPEPTDMPKLRPVTLSEPLASAVADGGKVVANKPVESLANRRFDIACPQCGAKPYAACRDGEGNVQAVLHESRDPTRALKVAGVQSVPVGVEQSTDEPGPRELWLKAGGGTPEYSREKYIALMKIHGHIKPSGMRVADELRPTWAAQARERIEMSPEDRAELDKLEQSIQADISKALSAVPASEGSSSPLSAAVAVVPQGAAKPDDEQRRLMGGHLPTCGRACTGEPMCSEVWDVVQGIGADDRRRKYGVLPIDVVCPDCGSGPGSICMGLHDGQKVSGPKHTIAFHSARGVAAETQRNIDRGKAS